jgi:DNA polymerase III subunit gamma/tau
MGCSSSLPLITSKRMADSTLHENAAGYRVLARKYRPRDFSALIGQDALVRTLTNAFATGRIAQAYMLTGVRGIGKTTTARLIARALNYPAGATVDLNEMTAQCEAILESRHIDVIEMDAASNTGVDNMREIIDSVRYAPVQARTKVYIIDEVHMLSKSAFNALLKTLEEPPPHVKFIFATTEIRKVPVTILSRCQRFDLKRLDAGLLMQHYGNIARLENVEAEDEALRMIARAAEGSVRDGLSLLDQAIAYGDGKVRADDVASMLGIVDRAHIIDLFNHVMSGDPVGALAHVTTQFEGGADPQVVLEDLADFVHWVTRLKLARASALNDGARTEAEKSRGSEFADKLGMAALARAWQMLLKGIAETATASNPHAAAEMVLIRLAHAADLPSAEELARIVNQAPSAAPTPLRPLPTSVTNNFEPQGNLAPALAASTPPVVPTDSQPVALANFIDIVKHAEAKRDIKLKAELERYVRPVRVSAGKIELALELGTPQGFVGELKRKLDAWTGQRWIVSLVNEKGEDPIAKQKQARRSSIMDEAKADPVVQAVLKAFPGATITDVKQPPTADISITTATEDTDEEPL